MERTALSILRDIDGGVTTEATSGDGRKADIVIHAGDVSHVVELKKAQRSINAANARALIEQAQRLPKKATHLLLVARSTTKEARRLLADAGVALIDGQGNMRVDLPGIFVWTERRPPHAASEKRQANLQSN